MNDHFVKPLTHIIVSKMEHTKSTMVYKKQTPNIRTWLLHNITLYVTTCATSGSTKNKVALYQIRNHICSPCSALHSAKNISQPNVTVTKYWKTNLPLAVACILSYELFPLAVSCQLGSATYPGCLHGAVNYKNLLLLAKLLIVQLAKYKLNQTINIGIGTFNPCTSLYNNSALTLLVGQQEGHLAGWSFVGDENLTGALHNFSLQLSPTLPSSLAAIKPANPGSPGKWPLKWRTNIGHQCCTMVNFPTCTGTKLILLADRVTYANLPKDVWMYPKWGGRGVESMTSWSQVQHPTATPTSHTIILSSNKFQKETFWYRLTQVHLEKWPIKWGERVSLHIQDNTIQL